MNFDSLVDLVRSKLDQDENTLPDSIMVSLVESVEGILNRELRDHPRNFTRLAYSINAEQNRVPLPDRMVNVKSFRLNGNIYEQYPHQMEDEAKLNQPSFIHLGDCLEIYPPPSEYSTYYLDGNMVLNSITEELPGENWISKYFSDVYEYGVLAEAAGYLRDTQNEERWKQEFNHRLNSLILVGWNAGITDVPTMRND